MQTIRHTALPAIGQGTWYMGESASHRQQELAALRTGVEHGLTLIDTAEMYGEGAAESLVGEAIKPLNRDELFIVSKVYPHNAGGKRLVASCEHSLRRMGVDTIDLYLLHWRGGVPLAETVAGMKALQAQGKIRYWGVSNLDTADMAELLSVGGGDCQADQVLYHLGSRGVEFELLPWLQKQNMGLMAYCPLAQAGTLRRGLMENAAVTQVARRHGWTPAQVLLAFAGQNAHVLPIPKAAEPKHALENAAMLNARLTEEDMAVLNAAYPPPTKKLPLDMQ